MGAPPDEVQQHETLPGPDPEPAEARPVTVKLVRERRRRRKTDSTPPEQSAKPTAVEAPTEPAFVEIHEPAPESLPLVAPERWDRYEIVGLLGRGGMGAVYEARDKRLDRHVAIKFIHGADPVITKRFLQEARAQARIDHPNVCKVLEVGEVEGKAYIAMQLIRGESLIDAVRDMSVDDKVRLMKTVTEAVYAAHRLGIIHRDIKPANIMVETIVGADGSRSLRPVLMDFGLAREASETQGLTESGAVMGTPAYMPPEQARGSVRSIDERSDVYSLGATLYDLITGEPPFTGESAVNILLEVLVKEPVPLRVKVPDVPPALDIIVGKCLNKEPHQRYASAADLADDLERFLMRERVLARRLGLLTRLYWRAKRNKPMAAAVVALGLTLIGFAGFGIRTVVVNARNEAIAKKRAELGQKLGQAVKELEWLVRSAYLVPLHDTGPEKALVRDRMAKINEEMRGYGDLGAGLDHYALGRGHLALKEWDEARTELEKAEALGVHEPELDHALGRALGELYSRALEDARRSGDKSYFEKRKEELDREYLANVLSRLERCRGLETVPSSYLEALIHFYHGRYDEALRHAAIAREKLPWLYEAAKLEGDVYMARALNEKDKGENESAERDFAEAVSHYERAADVGRSDHEVHEALAEAWIRQEEMDLYRGKDPAPKLEKALAAAEKALVAAPKESHGHTKKAFAYHFEARYAEGHGATAEAIERLRNAQIDAGKKAIASHPEDAYAHEITGLAYTRLSMYLMDRGKPVDALLSEARAHLEEAIRRNPRFPWAHNDYGFALAMTGISKKQRNEDPRDFLKKAIEATRAALTLDERYLIAYNNTALWLTELAEWKAHHGENPEKDLREAIDMADQVLRINPKHPLAYGNSGLAYARIASYRLDAGEDGREAAAHAIERFEALLGVDPSFVLAHRDLAAAHRLMASHERNRGGALGRALDEGTRVVKQCLKLEPRNADCMSVEAELRAEEGEWALLRGAGPAALDSFEKAEGLAREATREVPDRADPWLTLGQICLQRARAMHVGKGPAGATRAVVDEGLVAIERALDRAPGSPWALAIRGTLFLYEAELDPAKRADANARARASLATAFKENPLLERSYGKVADAAPPSSGP